MGDNSFVTASRGHKQPYGASIFKIKTVLGDFGALPESHSSPNLPDVARFRDEPKTPNQPNFTSLHDQNSLHFRIRQSARDQRILGAADDGFRRLANPPDPRRAPPHPRSRSDPIRPGNES